MRPRTIPARRIGAWLGLLALLVHSVGAAVHLADQGRVAEHFGQALVQAARAANAQAHGPAGANDHHHDHTDADETPAPEGSPFHHAPGSDNCIPCGLMQIGGKALQAAAETVPAPAPRTVPHIGAAPVGALRTGAHARPQSRAPPLPA